MLTSIRKNVAKWSIAGFELTTCGLLTRDPPLIGFMQAFNYSTGRLHHDQNKEKEKELRLQN